jgi:alkanesulfonate monooxygenase SsuD/methylene tetrahydromethanopterin reductase-like flavin-dependent oxidoreductase (luciferase family)
MKVWFYHNSPWPFRRSEIPFPFPGEKFDRNRGPEVYNGYLDLYRLADELGFDGMTFTEHHYTKIGSVPSPNLMAAAAATHTSNAQLVIIGNCLPMHGHPIRVAEELALIDALSNGRLVSGFVRGGAREYYAYGIDIHKGREMFEEAWELIVRAWTDDEPFAWHGTHYDYDVVSIVPRPVQRPHPPIVLAGNTSESIEWVAQHKVPLILGNMSGPFMVDAFGYFQKYSEDECGWTPGPEHRIAALSLYVAETDAKARELAEGWVWDQYRELAGMYSAPQLREMNEARRTERSYAYQPAIAAARTDETEVSYDELVRGRYCVGSPDTVTRRILDMKDKLDIGTLMPGMLFGGMRPADVEKSMELFAKEVMPAVR